MSGRLYAFLVDPRTVYRLFRFAGWTGVAMVGVNLAGAIVATATDNFAGAALFMALAVFTIYAANHCLDEADRVRLLCQETPTTVGKSPPPSE